MMYSIIIEKETMKARLIIFSPESLNDTPNFKNVALWIFDLIRVVFIMGK
ncbi:hypothetical protein BWGOE6_55960 [Bacillus mycoides]|nr:hypothetical protein BWGOE6_55960 [Bacillus mycoides]